MTFHYEHQGFCPCCETPQTFTTDSDWFRDTLCCPNCGSVPRERAIALVLNEIFFQIGGLSAGVGQDGYNTMFLRQKRRTAKSFCGPITRRLGASFKCSLSTAE